MATDDQGEGKNGKLPQGLLWKYLGLNEEGRPRIGFLIDELFRVTQPQFLNDPFEMKARILRKRPVKDIFHGLA